MSVTESEKAIIVPSSTGAYPLSATTTDEHTGIIHYMYTLYMYVCIIQCHIDVHIVCKCHIDVHIVCMHNTMSYRYTHCLYT